MKISTQSEVFARKFGDERAIELLAKAGFDAVDWTLFGVAEPSLERSDDELRDYFGGLRKVVETNGIYINQTHSPFPTSVFDDERDAVIFERLRRAIIASGALGARITIVHPIILRENRYGSLAKENKELNISLYSKLIPYARENNVKIAVENMWNFDNAIGKICPTVCSSSVEMADYVDTLNEIAGEERFVACLDLGHTTLAGEAPLDEMLETLGSRLKALHVHDNDGIHDSHTAPGFGGKVDFAALARGLKAVKYDGELTFEADAFYKSFDEVLLFDAGELLAKIGHNFCEKYEL